MKTVSSGNTVLIKGVRVLGIDPGSRICGYGIIETVTGQPLLNSHNSSRSNPSTPYRYIASGRVEMSHASLHQRLKAVVEKVFFAKGVKSALNLGHARGVSLLAATSGGLPIYEYSALEVKKAVVGYGRAEKRQVQQMVRVILDLKNALSPDSADALALSICHLNTMRLGRP